MTEAVFLNGYENTKSIFVKNKLLILLSAVFTFGIILGAWSVCISDGEDYFGIRDLFSGYFNFLSENSYFLIFLNSVFCFSFLLILSFLFGTCCFGFILTVLFLFFYSFGTGISSGFLYSEYSLEGICFFCIIMLPGLFLFSLVYIICAKQSFVFSLKIMKTVKSIDSVNVRLNLKKFILKYSVYFLYTIFVSLINAGFSRAFIGYFDF